MIVFSQNPGLRRRFPWTFTISNFNGEQLQKVYNKMCNSSKFQMNIQMMI